MLNPLTRPLRRIGGAGFNRVDRRTKNQRPDINNIILGIATLADESGALRDLSQRHQLLAELLTFFVAIMRFFTPRNERLRKGKGAFLTGVWGLLSISMLPSLAMADKTAADYFVHSLPGAPDGPLLKMHAGQVNPIFWTLALQANMQSFLADTSRSMNRTMVICSSGITRIVISRTSNGQ